MRYIYVLLALLTATTSFAEPGWISVGAYQLVCAPDDEERVGELTVQRVQVIEKEAKLIIIIDDQAAEVRSDDTGAVLFTIPINVGVRGAAVAQKTFVSKRPYGRPFPARVDGIFLTAWPGAVVRGRFALIPVDDKKG